MSYRHLVTTLGTVLVLGARPLAAQSASASPATGSDSMGTLAPVVVTAEGTTPRATAALSRENRKLHTVLRMQDRRIAELRARVATARAASAAKEREIATIESVAAETRSQRLLLEQRLRDAAVRTATGPRQ